MNIVYYSVASYLVVLLIAIVDIKFGSRQVEDDDFSWPFLILTSPLHAPLTVTAMLLMIVLQAIYVFLNHLRPLDQESNKNMVSQESTQQ